MPETFEVDENGAVYLYGNSAAALCTFTAADARCTRAQEQFTVVEIAGHTRVVSVAAETATVSAAPFPAGEN